MAPEVIASKSFGNTYNELSDIWCVGCVGLVCLRLADCLRERALCVYVDCTVVCTCVSCLR
jgi:hypothetical protein